jgi:hypothetical protein
MTSQNAVNWKRLEGLEWERLRGKKKKGLPSQKATMKLVKPSRKANKALGQI